MKKKNILFFLAIIVASALNCEKFYAIDIGKKEGEFSPYLSLDLEMAYELEISIDNISAELKDGELGGIKTDDVEEELSHSIVTSMDIKGILNEFLKFNVDLDLSLSFDHKDYMEGKTRETYKESSLELSTGQMTTSSGYGVFISELNMQARFDKIMDKDTYTITPYGTIGFMRYSPGMEEFDISTLSGAGVLMGALYEFNNDSSYMSVTSELLLAQNNTTYEKPSLLLGAHVGVYYQQDEADAASGISSMKDLDAMMDKDGFSVQAGVAFSYKDEERVGESGGLTKVYGLARGGDDKAGDKHTNPAYATISGDKIKKIEYVSSDEYGILLKQSLDIFVYAKFGIGMHMIETMGDIRISGKEDNINAGYKVGVAYGINLMPGMLTSTIKSSVSFPMMANKELSGVERQVIRNKTNLNFSFYPMTGLTLSLSLGYVLMYNGSGETMEKLNGSLSITPLANLGVTLSV